jgi:hypothetical protein
MPISAIVAIPRLSISGRVRYCRPMISCMTVSGGDRAYRCHQARPAYLPTCDVRSRDLQQQLYVGTTEVSGPA